MSNRDIYIYICIYIYITKYQRVCGWEPWQTSRRFHCHRRQSQQWPAQQAQLQPQPLPPRTGGSYPPYPISLPKYRTLCALGPPPERAEPTPPKRAGTTPKGTGGNRRDHAQDRREAGQAKQKHELVRQYKAISERYTTSWLGYPKKEWTILGYPIFGHLYLHCNVISQIMSPCCSANHRHFNIYR